MDRSRTPRRTISAPVSIGLTAFIPLRFSLLMGRAKLKDSPILTAISMGHNGNMKSRFSLPQPSPSQGLQELSQG